MTHRIRDESIYISMEPNVFLAFVIATSIMLLLPGPSVLLTVAHSISFGWQRGLITVAGETAGIGMQLLIAAIGLASLLNAVADALVWIRWAGAAYLIYLGIKQWQSAGTPLELDRPSASARNLWMQGFAVTVPNPKSLIFIAAFLPQFIDSSRPIGIQFAVIVPVFLLVTFVITGTWALVAGQARNFLLGQPALQNVLRGAGVLMIFAGVGLALARRSS